MDIRKKIDKLLAKMSDELEADSAVGEDLVSLAYVLNEYLESLVKGREILGTRNGLLNQVEVLERRYLPKTEDGAAKITLELSHGGVVLRHGDNSNYELGAWKQVQPGTWSKALDAMRKELNNGVIPE